jgi:glutathione S-transferase
MAVPVMIEADGFTLAESWAAARYIMDAKASPEMRELYYPEDPKKRCTIDMHAGLLNDLRQQCGVLFRNNVFGKMQPAACPPKSAVLLATPKLA